MFETFISHVEFICIGRYSYILLCAVYICVSTAVVSVVIEPNRVKKGLNPTRHATVYLCDGGSFPLKSIELFGVCPYDVHVHYNT